MVRSFSTKLIILAPYQAPSAVTLICLMCLERKPVQSTGMSYTHKHTSLQASLAITAFVVTRGH